MAWRSVVISKPARLSFAQRAMVIEQNEGTARVPLEDIAAIVIDNPQITITVPLLVACADAQVIVITVDDSHTPNGVFLSHTPHSRAVKVMRGQLAMSEPHKKRLWQLLVQQKIRNQAQLLAQAGKPDTAKQLHTLANSVRSGDPDNLEAQAAARYFPALFGKSFTRDDIGFVNSALNYGYAIIRSAIARSLVSYGFLPAFGLHHSSELNAFNLADDIIEPYRTIVDQQVLALTQHYHGEDVLTAYAKSQLVKMLHQDTPRLINNEASGASTLLSLIDASVMSLGQSINTGSLSLTLPSIAP
ncbi:MAG: type II CRISPR-associated endonuclease Cas1 [Proteobacteria bacterium]|nr:type II CRISPR-associated endonuclease Cas1 [Pseudomonadota bacterium]